MAFPLVVFFWYNTVYVYNEELGTMVAQFSRNVAPEEQPHFFDVPNGTTHISRTPATSMLARSCWWHPLKRC